MKDVGKLPLYFLFSTWEFSSPTPLKDVVNVLLLTTIIAFAQRKKLKYLLAFIFDPNRSFLKFFLGDCLIDMYAKCGDVSYSFIKHITIHRFLFDV